MSAGNGNKVAADYIQENFVPSDRLTVVLVKKSEGAVIQRLALARAIALADFQEWLCEQNRHGYEVYVSMNALHPAARGRTKRDVQSIRHIYLDFDRDGTAAVERLLARSDLPKPNYRVNSSPGRWQVIWKAVGFAKEKAENLQRELALETGADPAAVDSARVLRLPGYYNHKYGKPYLVSVERLATGSYGPDRFPRFPSERGMASVKGSAASKSSRQGLSQSEKDWSFAKRALARGDSMESVIVAITNYRRNEKSDAAYYATHTVRKAAAELAKEQENPDRARA